MNNQIFTGVCTALVTPFIDGKINYPMAEMLIRRQIDAGVKAIVLAGTTGEASTLSDNEKIELFRRCKAYVGDSCQIIAGTGTNCTARSLELSISAENVGVDGLLMVTPYYNKTTPDGLYIHYCSIAQAVNLPIIAYNVPSRTGLDIPISVYAKLSKVPNWVGVKEASCDITKITKTRCACGNRFSIWTGNDDLIVPAMSLGALGVISVLSNVCPRETADMANAAIAGDFDTASDLQCQLQPLVELLFCEVNPIPVKAAMRYLGYDCGGCRLPLTELTKENQMRLNSFFG